MRSAVLAALLLAGGCGSENEANPTAPPSSSPGDEPTAPSDLGAAEGTDPEPGAPDEGSRAHAEEVGRSIQHLDLLALVHLAEIDHHGLYVDFGSPARMKYTNGQWRNGWGADVERDGATYTRMGDAGRIHFDLGSAAAHTLRLRIRKVASPNVVAYLNGETLRTIDLSDGVQEYDVELPAEHLVVGENQVRLRATETRAIDGVDTSIEIDSMRVIPGTPGEAPFEAPTHATLVRDISAGGEGRRALALRAPTTVSYHLRVPVGGRLALGIGGEAGTTARVRVTPDVGQAIDALDVPVTDAWRDRVVDLASVAGKVVRLDISVTGGPGVVGVSAPAILVPMPERRPPAAPARNVVVLTIDTLRASKLRAYDPRSRVQTPVLDQFAREGTLFEAAQAPENWTKPSVASILTSLTPTTHQTKNDAARLSESALMLSEVFHEQGFATAMFSANGYVSDRFGFDQDWDHYTNYIRENRTSAARNVFDEAMGWVEENRERRFFLYIQTIDPHVAYDPPERFLRMYDPSEYHGQVEPRRTAQLLADAKRRPPRVTFDAADRRRLEALHDGEISYHDVHFGRFLDKLRELGLYDDMIFVVTSDHGEEFDDHGSWGHGHSVFQELLGVPLIVRWPAVGTEAARVSDTVSTMDIAPTVLEAAGLQPPDVFEGRSLRPYLLGHARTGPAVAFSEFLEDRRVIREGNYKLILRGNQTSTMFDLAADPGEQRQLEGEAANRIGLRYVRILLGQYLGATDRRSWLHGSDGGPNVLPAEDASIDAELCEQLRALGYHDARCEGVN